MPAGSSPWECLVSECHLGDVFRGRDSWSSTSFVQGHKNAVLFGLYPLSPLLPKFSEPVLPTRKSFTFTVKKQLRVDIELPENLCLR